jgi:hypothetical protein
MSKRTIIAEILEIADELDNINYINESNTLTKIAQVLAWGNPMRHGEPPIDPPEYPEVPEEQIIKRSLEIMRDIAGTEIPEDMEIPDEIWQRAEQEIIDKSAEMGIDEDFEYERARDDAMLEQ